MRAPSLSREARPLPVVPPGLETLAPPDSPLVPPRGRLQAGKPSVALGPQSSQGLEAGRRTHRLHGALVSSSGCPHLVAEPVTVGLVVNLHDDVVHLRDPHKPVAFQEPGRQHSSAQEPWEWSRSPARWEQTFSPSPSGPAGAPRGQAGRPRAGSRELRALPQGSPCQSPVKAKQQVPDEAEENDGPQDTIERDVGDEEPSVVA